MIDILRNKKCFPGNQSERVSCTLREYCLWLVHGKKGRGPRPIDSMQMRKGDKWYARCEELFREAENLARSGVQRGDMSFDDLKQRSLALADEVFSGSDRGVVFGRIAKVFDSAMRGGVTPNKVSQQVSHEKSREKGIDGHWISYPRMDLAKYLALNEIQRFAGWDPPSPENLARVKESFLKKYPVDQDLVQKAETNGRLYRVLMASAFQLGFSKNGEVVLSEQMSKIGLPDCYRGKVLAAFERGRTAMTRRQEAKAFKRLKKGSSKEQGKQPVQKPRTSAFKMVATPAVIKSSGIHPNSIIDLKPAQRWTIVSDETGSVFDNDAFDSKKGAGYYVFVLIPDYANLPMLQRGWHAVSQSLKSLVSAGEDLTKSGCGIIGIPVKGLHPTNRQLWFACIETLLDIVLRILPVDGKTEIVLNVEQRGAADSRNVGLLEKTADDVMYHLSLVNPEKAKDICLSAAFISKTGCLFNGYADLVAFSRGCGKDTRQVLGKFGWEGPCLISDSPDVVHAFRRCLDLVHQGVLPVADWNILVQSRDAQAAGSLIGALLRTFGEEARKDVARWKLYLDYVMAHLDSKAIRMSVLGPQIAWLKEYEPDAAQLPPRLRLLWLTAQLAESNHLGGTKFGSELYEREFIDLCERLKDEDAPLTCFAALHLAVEKTDSYEFDVARSILKPWERERIAVPGLRYHAQVLSSLGQHAAFLGDNTKALEYFRKAMDEFKHLSADWQRDFDHTCAYAVIAAMDAGNSEMNDLMATYLYGGTYSIETMVDMAQQLSAVGEDEPDTKYAHAILLRYIATLPPDNPVRDAYVSNSAKWQWSEDGHPWELIAFYRALLLPQDGPARCDWLRKGYNLCANGGPTLRAIAAVLLGALLYDGAASRDEYVAKVEEAISLLPNLGKARASALLAHADKPLSPLDLAKIVLPFNFR